MFGPRVNRRAICRGTGHRLRMRGSDQLDAALLELGPEVRKLLLVQLVLVRVGVEGLLLELSELLRLLDEGAGFQFSKLGQFSHSFYFFKGQAPGRRLHHLKRSGGSYYSVLQQDLPGFLVGQDLPFDPLKRVVNRLRVAVQLLCHLLVRRALQVET